MSERKGSPRAEPLPDQFSIDDEAAELLSVVALTASAGFTVRPAGIGNWGKSEKNLHKSGPKAKLQSKGAGEKSSALTTGTSGSSEGGEGLWMLDDDEDDEGLVDACCGEVPAAISLFLSFVFQ